MRIDGWCLKNTGGGLPALEAASPKAAAARHLESWPGVDQTKPLDPAARKARPTGETQPDVPMDEILAQLETVLGER